MDKSIEKKEFRAEKEKLKQFIEEKHGEQATGTSQKGSEEKKDKNNEVIKSSSSSSASSTCKNARSCSSSSDYYPPKGKTKTRKRRARTRVRGHSTKRVRIQKRSKSSKNKRKKSNKRRKRSRSRSRRRKSQSRQSRQSKKGSATNVCSEKSDDGNKSTNDDAYNREYHKKLDALARYGGNFYCASIKQKKGLKPIYIDGSNVAYSHGQNERFSVEGLKICIDYFRKRGHTVKAFVPNFRLRKGESTDHHLLHQLVNKKLVITTPTLYIQNQRRSPYDDWYIIQSAAANGGIIVSADNFQDIIKWNPNLRSVIEECRLVPTFVDDMLIFPVDPHGNRQNNLDQFLRF